MVTENAQCVCCERSCGNMDNVWVIIPTVFLFQTVLYGNQLCLFMLMYLIGGYFKKYPQNLWENKSIRKWVFCGSFVLLYLSSVIIEVIGCVIPFAADKGGILYHKNSILIVGIAVSLFAYGIYYKKTYNSVVNIVAGGTFGVYLIHNNPAFRDIIWRRWLDSTCYAESWFLPIILVINSVIVFFISLCIEWIYQYFLKKYCLKLGDYLFALIEKLFVRLRLKLKEI